MMIVPAGVKVRLALGYWAGSCGRGWWGTKRAEQRKVAAALIIFGNRGRLVSGECLQMLEGKCIKLRAINRRCDRPHGVEGEEMSKPRLGTIFAFLWHLEANPRIQDVEAHFHSRRCNLFEHFEFVFRTA